MGSTLRYHRPCWKRWSASAPGGGELWGPYARPRIGRRDLCLAPFQPSAVQPTWSALLSALGLAASDHPHDVERCSFSILVLPNSNGDPTRAYKLGIRIRITTTINGDLFNPELLVRLGNVRAMLWATVPETTIHKDGYLFPVKYYIRFTAQLADRSYVYSVT
jgi:hypothetical protein